MNKSQKKLKVTSYHIAPSSLSLLFAFTYGLLLIGQEQSHDNFRVYDLFMPKNCPGAYKYTLHI